MGKGIIRAFLFGALTLGALGMATHRPSPKDEARAAQAAVTIVQSSNAAGKYIKAGDLKQAELHTLKAATEANQSDDKTLENQLKMTADALDLLHTTKLKLSQMIEQKTNFETLARIEEDTYFASAKRLEEYIKIIEEQGWDTEMREEVQRSLRPVLLRAIEIGDGVMAHGHHEDVIRRFKIVAVKLL